jgi:hypothetical protein
MDGITSLLAGTADATARGYRSLPKDAGSWGSSITAQVYRLIPPSLPVQASVHMNQTDEVNGFGIGSVHLADNDGNVKGFMPIVIRRFKLAPLDIIVLDGKFHPFSEELIRKTFSGDEIAEGLADKKELREYNDQDLTNITQPPNSGMYNTASDKGAFLLSIGEEDQDAFSSFLKEGSWMLGALNKLGCAESVRSLLEKRAAQEPAAAPISVITWEKLAAHKYRIMTTRSGTFGPSIVEVDERGLRVSVKDAEPESKDELLDQIHNDNAVTRSDLDDKEEAGVAGETLNEGPRGSEVILYRTDKAKPEQGSEHGAGFAMTTAGARIRGILFPSVIDLDGKKVDTKLFIGRGVSGVQPQIAIEPVSGKIDLRDVLEDTVPRSGETGTLVHLKGDSAVALAPFTIRSVQTNASTDSTRSSVVLDATTMLGGEVSISISPMVKGIAEISRKGSKKRRYTVSSDFYWVPMGEFKEFMTSPNMMKSAGDFERTELAPKVRVINTGLGYCLQAPWVKTAEEKTGLDMGCLSWGEASHVLSSLGCHTKAASGILNIADERSSATVIGLAGPYGAAQEKTASSDELTEKVASVRTLARSTFPILLAYSAEIEKRGAPKDTVDSSLELNFMNPQNVEYFTGLVPKFSDTIDALGKLLIATRVGLPEVDEGAVKAALRGVSQIRNDLRDLTYTDEIE